MQKNGFTFIEIIAVIVMLAILSLILIPSLIDVKNTILKSAYDNKIILINNAAKDYGNDFLNYVPSFSSEEYNFTDTTDTTRCNEQCLCVSIDDLIKNGYIKGDSDDKTQIINPIDNESLNSLGVCIRYDTNILSTRKIISYVTEYDDNYSLKISND